jgi:hypothetical protein
MNQSKDTVYNLDKIISIESLENGIVAQCDKAESHITLGTYESEARAKEVLMELFETYGENAQFKTTQKGTKFVNPKLYEMPDE